MYKEGTIIAVNGNLYEYGGIENAEYSKGKLHKVYVIDIDEEGILTATHSTWYFNEEKLAINEVNFTKDQWYGIVAHFIREGDFDLNEEEMEDATEDIVGRCFAYGIPKIHELADYIADYMNR